MTQDEDRRHAIERSHFDSVAESRKSEGPIYATLSPVLIDRHVISKLGEIDGKTVVECGCGTGQLLARIAARGAHAYGFDISDGMVELAKRTVAKAGLSERVMIDTMTLEHTTYANDNFDLVVGVAVLHHTDLADSREEVRRILKPGGRGLFFEPMRGNPVISLFRSLTPRLRTPTEMPFSVRDIAFFMEPFAGRTSQELYLTGLLGLGVLALTKSRRLFRLIVTVTDPIDQTLVALIPYMRRLCGFTVLEVVK